MMIDSRTIYLPQLNTENEAKGTNKAELFPLETVKLSQRQTSYTVLKRTIVAVLSATLVNIKCSTQVSLLKW